MTSKFFTLALVALVLALQVIAGVISYSVSGSTFVAVGFCLLVVLTAGASFILSTNK